MTPSVWPITASGSSSARSNPACRLSSRACSCIRHRQLRSVIDTAGPRRQRWLEQVGAVSSQQEGHVAVAPETVHLVEQLKQQASTRIVVAFLSDEIDILDDYDGGWSARATEQAAAIMPSAARDHGSDAWQASQEVADRVGLARARDSVEQHAAAQVLAARTAPGLRVPRDAQYLPLDAVQDRFRQDDLVTPDVRPVEKGEEPTSLALEHLAPERDDMSAEHVVLQA